MMTLLETIGHRLRIARQTSGLTQDQAASAVGIHRVQLSLYESGKREIDITMLARLAALYGYTMDHFLRQDAGEEEQVNIAFRAEDVTEEDLTLVEWAKNFVLAASELERILERTE